MAYTSLDPFGTFDRLLGRAGFGDTGSGRSLGLPVDVYREGNTFIVEMDVPGIDPSKLDLQLERNMLSVTGERPARHDAQPLLCERPHARFTRQLYLGEDLDTEAVSANYDNGVLTITIPMSTQAGSRRIEIAGSESGQRVIDAKSSEQA